MHDEFKAAAAPSEAEAALREWGIRYRKDDDGTLIALDSIHLSLKNLTRLPDLSAVVVLGSFWCNENALTSLEGAPRRVKVGFYCHRNQLTSLEHAPQSVGGCFCCTDNALASLEDIPGAFKSLRSDFGTFSSWREVPENLAPQTKDRLLTAEIRAATVLQAPLHVTGPLRFRRNPHDL